MRWALGLCLALSLAAPAAEGAPRAGPSPWLAAWATPQQVPEAQNALAAADLEGGATLRQIVRLGATGPKLRIRLSNAYGQAPLRIGVVRVAAAQAFGSDATAPGTDRAVTFAGAAEALIPPSADLWSDPVDARGLGRDLAVSLYLSAPPAQQTGHPGSRTTSFLVAGDHAADAALPGAKRIDHWYQLSGVEVSASGRAVVAVGDSITDGRGSTTNGNDRWTDQLAARLGVTPKGRGVVVLNAGIGGNRLLNDGLGPNALARFDRDVLTPPGVRAVIVLEGINDIGTLSRERRATADEHAAQVRRMIGAYEQMIGRAHAHGLKIYGGTLTPFAGSDYDKLDPLNEADRQAVNAWIRSSGRFDAVVDFDAAVRDPAAPARLKPQFDTGDHLHPSPAGYKAMAQAVPLDLLTE